MLNNIHAQSTRGVVLGFKQNMLSKYIMQSLGMYSSKVLLGSKDKEGNQNVSTDLIENITHAERKDSVGPKCLY